MKKMLTNKKGFSLVELLIVLAIMGVLAAIAFSMFAGVFGNATKKADERQADNIAKAITAYIVDANDSDLSGIGITDTSSVEDVIKALMLIHEIQDDPDDADSPKTKYGPYLTAKNGIVPATLDDAVISDFYPPQWSGYSGYEIKTYQKSMMASVKPVETGSLDLDADAE